DNADDFGDLKVTGAGTWTLSDDLVVTDDVDLAAGTLATAGYSLDIGGNITLNGTLNASSGAGGNSQINLTGNWANSGTFTPGSSTVVLDGTSQQITGSSNFYNLTKSVTSADTLTFGAGATQTITGTATLGGASGSLLSLRSSASGTQWRIDPQGTRSISFVDVMDSYNIHTTVIGPASSTNSGNNTNWFAAQTAATTTPDTFPDPSPAQTPEPAQVDQTIDEMGTAETGTTETGAETTAESQADTTGETDADTAGETTVASAAGPVQPTATTSTGQGAPGVLPKSDSGKEDGRPATTTHVYVYEGAVEVNKTKIYTGEKITVDPQGKAHLDARTLYITHVDGVRVLRATVNETIRHFASLEAPSDIISAPDGKAVYAILPSSRKLATYDTASLRNSGYIYGLNEEASQIILAAHGTKAFVANALTDTVQVVDLAQKKVTQTFSTGSHPSQILLTPDESALYVSNSLDGTVSKINAETGEEELVIKAGGSPYGLAYSDDGSALYITDTQNNRILIISTLSKTKAIPVGNYPHVIEKGPDGILYISNRGDGTVSVVDPKEGREIARLKVGERPAGIAITPSGDAVYVANEASGTVTLINPKEVSVIGEIHTGTGPKEIAISTPQRP
ncbi:MAG: YncE family protein, partial [Candidatus Omnitrophica bacterium]|nr:YncE family protein [Candidatus Omnitrophota bacterium]